MTDGDEQKSKTTSQLMASRRTYPFDGVLEFRKLLEFTGRSIGEVLETPKRGKHVPVHEGEPSRPERQNKLKIYIQRLRVI